MSSENPGFGKVDPTHIGPPDLILQEIIAPSEVPDDVRERVERSLLRDADRDVPKIEIESGGRPGRGREGSVRVTWADVTFAARALAFVEGTDQLEHDGYGDPLVWIFALRADSPVIGEMIVSAGGYGYSSSETRFSMGESPRRGRRVSFFSALRTEPRTV